MASIVQTLPSCAAPSLSPSAGEERAEGRAVHAEQLLARRALGHDDVLEKRPFSRSATTARRPAR